MVESKTGTRKSWFRFDSARASEIVVEMNKFQQPMRFGRFLEGFQSSPEVSIPGAVQKDRGLWGRDCENMDPAPSAGKCGTSAKREKI